MTDDSASIINWAFGGVLAAATGLFTWILGNEKSRFDAHVVASDQRAHDHDESLAHHAEKEAAARESDFNILQARLDLGQAGAKAESGDLRKQIADLQVQTAVMGGSVRAMDSRQARIEKTLDRVADKLQVSRRSDDER